MNSSPGTGTPPADEASADGDRVADWWHQFGHRVQAYAMRHVDPHTAQEVVAETFLVAWRRQRDVPDDEPGDVLPWLVGVARNVIRNEHRSARRGQALAARLDAVARRAPDVPAVDAAVAEREQVLLALAGLPEKHREALLLVAWDGLDREQAARVAGCRVGTFDVRLHRARRRLEELLATGDLDVVPSASVPGRRAAPARRPSTVRPLPDGPVAGGDR